MYDQVCYQKSFLKQVIIKVDFASPLVELQKGVPTRLLNTIIKTFPIIEPAEMLAHELSINGESVQSKQTMIKQWNYFAKDRSSQLTISSESIFVLYVTYKSFEETKEQFAVVIDALLKAFQDTKASRFGLRYINEIDPPLVDPTKWDEYINPKLLSNREFFDENETLTRLINIAELQYDDINVRFQFGIPNPDYPAPVKRPLFVLDLDASVSQAHDLAEVLPYMEAAHQHIQTIYERSITNELRGKMDVRPVQE